MASSIQVESKLKMVEEILADDQGINGCDALYKALYTDAAEVEATSTANGRGKRRSDFLSIDMFRNLYNGGNETRNLNLFDRIALKLDLKTPGSNLYIQGKTLFQCTASEFYGHLNNSHRGALLRRSTSTDMKWLKSVIDGHEIHGEHDNQATEETEQIIYRSLDHKFGDKKEVWQDRGVVDQKFMYLNLHSVENWRSLLDDPSYRPYARCISALTKLLGSSKESPWPEEAKNIDTVVIFGAGTPKKEFLIVQNLLKQERFTKHNKLRVVIVDASVYMLVDTYVQLRKLLEHDHLDQRVDIEQCWADFNKMKRHSHHIRKESGRGRVAFFLLGGTIGNIDEYDFLGSVLSVSEPGDLLTVSAEFVEQGPNRAKYLEELIKDYSGNHAKDLVLEPIRGLLDEKGIVGEMEKRRGFVSPSRLEDDPSLASLARIPGTVGVVLRIDRHGLHLALSISKRYDFQSFRDFFEQRISGHQFKFLTAIPSKEFEPYQQVMFVRSAA